MKELSQAIENAQFQGPEGLRETAKTWAIHSLNTYRDETLRRALAISEALAQFLNELEVK